MYNVSRRLSREETEFFRMMGEEYTYVGGFPEEREIPDPGSGSGFLPVRGLYRRDADGPEQSGADLPGVLRDRMRR